MKIAILSANLGDFDKPVDPVPQDLPKGVDEIVFHRFTDADFPPITGLTPRMQYRIPKMFGWQMLPGYDIYIWLDASVSLRRPDCVKWYMDQLGENDVVFFRHPNRRTVKEEVDHIEKKLQENHWYITPRYKNGLHKEAYAFMKDDPFFEDKDLYASTAFVYRVNTNTKKFLWNWWTLQSRYFSCDQIVLPYSLTTAGVKVTKVLDNLFKIGYLSLVSHHK